MCNVTCLNGFGIERAAMWHLWMSHVTCMNESRLMYGSVMSHTGMGHGMHVPRTAHQMCNMHEWVMAHIGIFQYLTDVLRVPERGCDVVCMDESYIYTHTQTHMHTHTHTHSHTHTRGCNVVCMNESCHIQERVMSRVWMSRVTYTISCCSIPVNNSNVICMNVSWHIQECVMSRVWISRVTHMTSCCAIPVNDSHHTGNQDSKQKVEGSFSIEAYSYIGCTHALYEYLPLLPVCILYRHMPLLQKRPMSVQGAHMPSSRNVSCCAAAPVGAQLWVTLQHTAIHCTTCHAALQHQFTHHPPVKNSACSCPPPSKNKVLSKYAHALEQNLSAQPVMPHFCASSRTVIFDTAAHCNTTQCSTYHAVLLRQFAHRHGWHCNTLQHTAIHCNTRQHNAAPVMPRFCASSRTIHL